LSNYAAPFNLGYSYNNDGSRSGLNLSNSGASLNLSWQYR
jgi:hypothetical protein